MKIQRGQSAVEFALVAPFIIAMILGMIYGGIMFLDYFNYNNFARTIAREISVATPTDRAIIKDKYAGYQNVVAGIYMVSIDIDYDDYDESSVTSGETGDVVVNIHFTRGGEYMFFMMPTDFTIKYRMKLENTVDTTT